MNNELEMFSKECEELKCMLSVLMSTFTPSPKVTIATFSVLIAEICAQHVGKEIACAEQVCNAIMFRIKESIKEKNKG